MKITKHALQGITTGFKTAFQNGFSGVPKGWEKIATVINSSTATEDYPWIGQFPNFREWIADRVLRDIEENGYSITNKFFESTISVPRNAIEDDQFGTYDTLFGEMGIAAGSHPNELIFGLLDAGNARQWYDGTYFFDTAHRVGGASVSNWGSGSGQLWVLADTTRPIKPIIFQKRKDYDFQAMDKLDDERVFTRKEFRYGVEARVNVGFGFWQMAYGSRQALSAENVNSARETMMSYKSEKGRPLGIKPNLLIVGAQNMSKAEELNQGGKAGQRLIEPAL
jgi:phage major head subunit gpT-like protein